MTAAELRRAAELLLLDAKYVRNSAEYHEKFARQLRTEEQEFYALASNLETLANKDPG